MYKTYKYESINIAERFAPNLDYGFWWEDRSGISARTLIRAKLEKK